MPSNVQWFEANVARFTTIGPIKAHQIAAQQAAGVSARMVQSKRSGSLARDVSRAKPVGPLRSLVGSSLPYAAIEHFGGTITAKNPDAYGRQLLYIRGTRGSSRSDVGGAITATKRQVVHKGKHYLDGALNAYPALMIAALAQEVPG